MSNTIEIRQRFYYQKDADGKFVLDAQGKRVKVYYYPVTHASAVLVGSGSENVGSKLSSLESGKVDKTDIVDNCTTNDKTKALSAKQGKVLYDGLVTMDFNVGGVVADIGTEDISAIGSTVKEAILTCDSNIGDPTELETEEQDSLVGAVNEVNEKLSELEGLLDSEIKEDLQLGEKENGTYYNDNGKKLSYGSSSEVFSIVPIDVSAYIGCNLHIKVTWSKYTDTSWCNLLMFKETNDVSIASSNIKGLIKERTAYSRATNNIYEFDVDVLDNYLLLSSRTAGTQFELTIEEITKGRISKIEDALQSPIVYVSTNGSDDNDGLTIVNSVATFATALTISNNIRAERGEYNEKLSVVGIKDICIMPYDNDEEYTHDAPNRTKIKIIGNTENNKNTAYFEKCDMLHIEDVVFSTSSSSVVKIKNSNNVKFINCEASGSTSSMGFEVINSDIIFNKCYASSNRYDGFNFHGYGCTILNDCVSENNQDDGCSHHDGCVGTINGGRFAGNGKCGIAPAYGAIVNIYNAFCKSNYIGIGYLSTNNGHASMNGIISSCAMCENNVGLKVDSLCSVTSINSKYGTNTTDKMVTGTLYEL